MLTVRQPVYITNEGATIFRYSDTVRLPVKARRYTKHKTTLVTLTPYSITSTEELLIYKYIKGKLVTISQH